MIKEGIEYYSSPYYFFLKEKKDDFALYLAAEKTIVEARKKDVMIKVPKDKVEDVKNFLKKISSKKNKSTDDLKGEIEELVNNDGSFSSSKLPILNPHLHPKKTMDQTVSAARITNDPIARGYRTYYGESVEKEMKEIDMSNVFGYEETSGMTGPKAYKYFMKELGLEPPDAEERVRQQGKNPFKNKKKITISEIQKQKAIKMLEDLLVKSKNTDNSEVGKKETDVSKILKKNIKSLKKQADREGISISELIKLLKSE